MNRKKWIVLALVLCLGLAVAWYIKDTADFDKDAKQGQTTEEQTKNQEDTADAEDAADSEETDNGVVDTWTDDAVESSGNDIYVEEPVVQEPSTEEKDVQEPSVEESDEEESETEDTSVGESEWIGGYF